MPGLIANLEGLTAILFHVEHSAGSSWQYRWRIVGDYPAPYLVWRCKTSVEKFARIHSEVRDAVIEVEWRDSPEAEWQPVALYEFTTGTARFTITSETAIHYPDTFTACAIIRDAGVAAYHFPAMALEPGIPAEITGTADAPAFANLLLTPGEFHPRIPGVTLVNSAPSEGSWREIPHFGAFPLRRCPHAGGRRWFAVGHEAVPAEVVQAGAIP